MTADRPAVGRRRRTGIVVALVVGAVGAAIVVPSVRAAGPGRDPAAVERPPATAVVERTTLTRTTTRTGTLGLGDGTPVFTRTAGTLTGTAPDGTETAAGEVLFTVDGLPTVLMRGEVPAHRDLSVDGADGTDVRQLEQALVDLGHAEGSSLTVDDRYTGATATAVRRWQESLGVEPTGRVALGSVAFLPATPVRVGSTDLPVGSVLTPGQRVLTVTGTTPAVTMDVDAADAHLVSVGDPVTVTLPDGTRTGGTVATVTAEPSGTGPGDGSGPAGEQDAGGLTATVTLDDPAAVGGYTRAPVRVAIVDLSREAVLAVPVTALLARSDGGHDVEVVDGDAVRTVAVQIGLVADGRVEVVSGLAEGQTVVVAP